MSGAASAATPAASVPTLYVWSDQDPALGRAAAEATAGLVSGPYRFEVLEGVGHWIPELAAARFNALLLEHLTSSGHESSAPAPRTNPRRWRRRPSRTLPSGRRPRRSPATSPPTPRALPPPPPPPPP